MKKIPLIAVSGLLAFAGLAPVAAQAQENDYIPYYGLQFARFTYEEDNFPDLEPTAAILRLGAMSEAFGYEARIGIGLSEGDDSITDPLLGDVDIEIEVDSLLGVYLVGQTGSESASFYGLFGYSIIDATATITAFNTDFSGSEDESGISFGFGVNFGRPGKTRFNIEYMSYLDEDEFSFDAVSLGVLF